MKSEFYDVLVVGGGHAGCEAALAAARLGATTMLLAINLDHIAQMSCNPAIGGIAKGQVAREVDALGGAMGRVADAATLQFRMLNRRKGPAVWSPRAQCDKVCYQRAMKRELELAPNLSIRQGEALGFILENGRPAGVVTNLGERLAAKSLVLANGTFLRGKLHYGMTSLPGGRAGDPASEALSTALSRDLGLRLGRLKTGTPTRVLAKSIDFGAMEKQESEILDEGFSHWECLQQALPRSGNRLMPCYMVYTNAETAAAVRGHIAESPLYAGVIEGIGTRYCPSFEDKVMRFPHHERHLLYLEPEGEHTGEYYLNGLSSSLPLEAQWKMLRSVPGLANAAISRYAYAIEYDFIFPDQLGRSLALKKWPNVFTAGQINGTSGYEEAAGQGLVAGVNAARGAAGLEPVEIGRDSAYIGVMIDDLVTKEITEPYRLFTSRAEFRLRLRQDNADIRLGPLASELGLLSAAQIRELNVYLEALGRATESARVNKVGGASVLEHLKRLGGVMPDTPPASLEALELPDDPRLRRRVLRQLLIQSHYQGYLEREDREAAKLAKLESWRLPPDFDYGKIRGLRNESRAKLQQVRPGTLAQAGRIDGVTPAEIALLQVFLK